MSYYPALSLVFSGLTRTATLILAATPPPEDDPEEEPEEPVLPLLRIPDLLLPWAPCSLLGDFTGRVGRPILGRWHSGKEEEVEEEEVEDEEEEEESVGNANHH